MDPPEIIALQWGTGQRPVPKETNGEERAGHFDVGPNTAVEMAPNEDDPSAFREVYVADGRADCTSWHLSSPRRPAHGGVRRHRRSG
jgi:hypothetical protein